VKKTIYKIRNLHKDYYREVEAEKIENFGIRKESNLFILDHIPTGMCLFKAETKWQAKQIAKDFIKINIEWENSDLDYLFSKKEVISPVYFHYLEVFSEKS